MATTKPAPRGDDMLDRLTDRSTWNAAFGRVADNGGCRGADGVTLGDFRRGLQWELDSIQDSLMRRAYHPLPLMEISIPKRGGGRRTLAVPTVRDRVVQSAVYLLTGHLFEAEFEDTSHGYRPGRSVRTAVRQVRHLRDQGYRYVVDADIDDFFARIPHDRLLARLQELDLHPYVRHLLSLWVRAEVYDGETVRLLERGLPQGSVVSPMMANLFLDVLDEQLAELGEKAVRYADDFLVLCRSAERAEEALELTDLVLEDLELDLDRGKSRIATFTGGFTFLGAIFTREGIFTPFERTKEQGPPPKLPPPLDLRTYLELKHHGG